MSASIEQLALALGNHLTAKGWKLITAESCTGGGLAYAITQIPGSSHWLERGLVTYSNISKEELLGVNSQTLANFGSVSKQTAQEMAEGALRNSKAQISIALTGIAGPDGGSDQKPVGTVWIACAATSTPTLVTRHLFPGNRSEIREQAIRTALELLLAQHTLT